MTSAPMTARSFMPESLMGGARLGDSEYRAVVGLLTWLGRVRQADTSHPRVRLWGVPACYGRTAVAPVDHTVPARRSPSPRDRRAARLHHGGCFP